MSRRRQILICESSLLLFDGRIVLSALYWGVEEKEQKLRDAVSSSLTSTPGLRVKILLDCTL